MTEFIEAQNEYNKFLIKEDTYWKQRAKMHWLGDEDFNTKFFHMSTTVRKEFSKITMLQQDEGIEVTYQVGICDIERSYFEELFVVKASNQEAVLSLIQPVITEEVSNMLITSLFMEELYNALREMHPNKSLSLDGLNLAFYQKI
ncbi:unnamed protein product [Lathyrus sativus]|nr:unnamed protein product [Lathyrus sativus]